MSENSTTEREVLKYLPHESLNLLDQEESGLEYKADKIKPAFAENNVAICMVASDEYAPFAGVLTYSIIANASKENNYDIVLLSSDMCYRNRWRIEKMAEGRDNISVRSYDISNMLDGFEFYTWAHFTKNTYYRLLVPDVFSAYEKVIYLDSDIVVNHDIAELYHTDVTGYYLAAAYDTHVVAMCSYSPDIEQRIYNEETLKLKDPAKYYQAGVSLFHINAINDDFRPGYLIKQAAEHKLRWLDQDLLNMLFHDKIKLLDNRWNVMVANFPDACDEYFLPAELRTEYFEARKAPFAIHYVGRAIPCFTATPDLYEYFWKYARQTVFYEILLMLMAEEAASRSSARTGLQQVDEMRLQHNKMYASYNNSLLRKLRRMIVPAINLLLPVGSKRRAVVRKIYNKLRGWE